MTLAQMLVMFGNEAEDTDGELLLTTSARVRGGGSVATKCASIGRVYLRKRLNLNCFLSFLSKNVRSIVF